MKNKFCPKCLSREIEMVAGGKLGIYECSKCKFRGAIFPEADEKLESKLKGMERRFCPKCRSENVEIGVAPVGIPNVAALGPINKCLDCGFESMIFPIKVKLNEKINQRRKRTNNKIQKLKISGSLNFKLNKQKI